MILKELRIGDTAKCTCEFCNGTGVYKGVAEREDLAVLCTACNGKGYNNFKIDEDNYLVKDTLRNIVYQVDHGMICGTVELFDGLKKRDDVNYVMYATFRFFSTSYLFEHGATEAEVIKYSDFLNGKLPIPMTKYTCPGQLIQNYSNNSFDNNCPLGCFSDCNKYGTEECWNIFYGESKTDEEKETTLKRTLN